MLENIDIAQLSENYVIPWGINIVLTIVIFFAGKYIVNVITAFSKKMMQRTGLDAILASFLSSIIKTVLLLFVVIAALDQLGLNTTSLIALIGAAGLAIALSLQGTLQNLASGVMLIMFRPFKNGDYIEAGGVAGIVENITIFNTVMRTGDNKEIIVPNGEIYGGTITNYSARPTRRIDMVFGISYNDDIRKARTIINDILQGDERILKEPEPLIAVGELADSSVNINVRPWVYAADYWPVLFDLNEKVKLAFDDSGITIPYPQMDIHQDQSN